EGRGGGEWGTFPTCLFAKARWKRVPHRSAGLLLALVAARGERTGHPGDAASLARGARLRLGRRPRRQPRLLFSLTLQPRLATVSRSAVPHAFSPRRPRVGAAGLPTPRGAIVSAPGGPGRCREPSGTRAESGSARRSHPPTPPRPP